MPHQDPYYTLSKKVGTEHSNNSSRNIKTAFTPEVAMQLNVLPGTLEELVQRFGKSEEGISIMPCIPGNQRIP